MSVKSPITGSENVVLEKDISVEFLIDAYKKQLGIDVKRSFEGVERVCMYRCLDTGYRFYHPSSIGGDDRFYQDLERLPWYYMDWKWEHAIAFDIVKGDDKVLEIGCARGGFLQKVREKGAETTGLEMNSSARKECAQRGIEVFSDPIEVFSKGRADAYDVVCSFQVLEHVYAVHDFIKASLSVLRPGGVFVVSVPNNDSFIFRNDDIIMNMPPHHLGRWNMNTLIKLQDHFGMKIDAIHIEPLQPYHLGYALDVAREKKNSPRGIMKVYARLFERMTAQAVHTGIASVSAYMVGHTILAVFKKRYDQ